MKLIWLTSYNHLCLHLYSFLVYSSSSGINTGFAAQSPREALGAEPQRTCGRRPAFNRDTKNIVPFKSRTQHLEPKQAYIQNSHSNRIIQENLNHYPDWPYQHNVHAEDSFRFVHEDIQQPHLLWSDDSEPRNNNLNKSGHIVGGRYAAPGQFPSYVKLAFSNDQLLSRGSSCGGTLVGPSTVLSAVHCLSGEESIENMKVITGLNSPQKSQMRAYKIDKICRWSKYCNYKDETSFRGTIPHYDMIVIKLSQRVQYNQYVQPACVPFGSRDLKPNGDDFFEGVGLGLTKQSDDSWPKALRYTRFSRKCQRSTINMNIMNSGGFVQCYLGISGTRACQGDSGGPMYYYRRNGLSGEYRQYVAGINSFGDGGCSILRVNSNFFSDIYRYEPYIKSIVNQCGDDFDLDFESRICQPSD